MNKFKELYGDAHNLCRVYELPTEYPKGYCFEGIPITMKMIDWFNPWPEPEFTELRPNNWQECSEMLKEFLVGKRYVKQGRKYILITEFGESMIFSGVEE